MSRAGEPNEADTVPYTEFVGSQDVPPPYHFPDVSVHAFVWEAQMGPIQRYCDTFLNLGPPETRGFEYRAAAFWPYALLLFLDYPNMISAQRSSPGLRDIPFSDRGITSQREVFVALPVVRVGKGLGGLTQSELEWVLPFITVSEPWSCVCGREMLGLGKLLADIRLGEGKFPDSFTGYVALPGWRTAFAGQMQEMLPLLEIATGPALPTFRSNTSPQSTLATLVDNRAAEWTIQNLAGVSNFIDQASCGLMPTAMRTIGLKQYRDTSDPLRAVYQALVTCRSKYSNVRDLQLFSEQDVTIAFHDTGSFHDLLQVFFDVGVSATNTVLKHKAVAAFRFDADIDYDQMRVVHEFAIDDGKGGIERAGQSDLTSHWFRPLKGFFGAQARP